MHRSGASRRENAGPYKEPAMATVQNGNHLRPRRLVLRQREKNHGTKIFEKGIRQGRTRDEGTQRRDLEERPLRAEGYKPQAGDRDRPFRSEGHRGEGPEKNRGQETQGQPKTEVEEVRNAFPVMPSSPGIATFPLCPATTLWPMQSCFHGFQ
jgi:hypothetical protein